MKVIDGGAVVYWRRQIALRFVWERGPVALRYGSAREFPGECNHGAPNTAIVYPEGRVKEGGWGGNFLSRTSANVMYGKSHPYLSEIEERCAIEVKT